MQRLLWLALLITGAPLTAHAEPASDPVPPEIDALYQALHRAPELSGHEERTAAKLAAQLRALGLEVSERVGGFGVVGVLKNGAGPTVLLRTELDALPIQEQTGLSFASTATTKNDAGQVVPLMHACGHDLHMAAWVGAATVLAHDKGRWRGTVVFVGQPAEEALSGAQRMIDDGLFARFPKPGFVVAQHVTAVLPSGQVGVIYGPALAAANAVDITFFGRGGHGAMPHLTVDPLLIAARTVVTLQTIVAREVNPLDAAIVTVGTFHAGTKRNIIADEAKLELTVRSFKPELQAQLLLAIERIAKAEAAAAGAPREPLVRADPREGVGPVVNDPALAARLSKALARGLGEASIVDHLDPSTASEDFGAFGRAAAAPSVMLALGASEPGVLAKAKAAGTLPPGTHSAKFAPDRERTLRTGIAALVLAVLELLPAQ